jgi:hypothetical protein
MIEQARTANQTLVVYETNPRDARHVVFKERPLKRVPKHYERPRMQRELRVSLLDLTDPDRA